MIAPTNTLRLLPEQHRSNDVPKSEGYEKGAATRREVMGDALTDKLASTVYKGPVMEKFTDYSTEAVFGMLWARPGLDYKTRALKILVGASGFEPPR